MESRLRQLAGAGAWDETSTQTFQTLNIWMPGAGVKPNRRVDQDQEVLRVSISKLQQFDFLADMVLQNWKDFDFS